MCTFIDVNPPLLASHCEKPRASILEMLTDAFLTQYFTVLHLARQLLIFIYLIHRKYIILNRSS